MCSCIGCEVVKIKDLIRSALWSSGAQGVVVGISGGIDSAVACALAVRAAGPERVLGVSMPSAQNNPADAEDAAELCAGLGVELVTVPLADVLSAFAAAPYIDTSRPILNGNVAARLRMTVLYNLAASRGYLVCGTSNKTEYLIGYSTKWGDSAADIQPLLHLLKKDVYALARELEIPERIMAKAPSAGFFDGQTDEAEIGMTYAEIDAALENLELNGFTPENSTEERVLAMVKRSEHKRMPALNRFGRV
ncbi:MAG: NAD(+) synthase [Methanocorpusculum sp.]|nr:NAD(+) synthase [Methanocorpusculum sp.]